MKKFKKIYIEITNNCNLNCSFCSRTTKPARFMMIEEFKHILTEIQNKTDYIYLHVTGEPLLHPQIIDFLQLAANYNLKVNLTTNGILFPKLREKLESCAALHKINFSLHCEQDKDRYEEEIMEAVDKLSTKLVIIYRLWTLTAGKLDKKSTEIVEKIIAHYKLSPIIVEKLKTESNIKISSTIYVDKDNEFSWPKLTTHKSCGYCYALKTHLAILCDGTVVPCCLDSNGIINLGNIFTESLESIMESHKYQRLKKSFQDRKPIEPLCQSCTFKVETK